MAKKKTDDQLATAARIAMDRLCKAMWEASQAGLRVECDGFSFWYGSEEVRGPALKINRRY